MIQADENNLYIRVSEFGYNHPGGFTYNELREKLELIKDGWEDKAIRRYMDNALKSGRADWSIDPGGRSNNWVNPNMDSIFFAIEKAPNENILDNHKFILKYDAYFNYIDYLELQSAKKSSKDANRNAIIALCAVIITTIFSMFFSWHLTQWQIESPVELDSNQFNRIFNNSKHKAHFNNFDKKYNNFN